MYLCRQRSENKKLEHFFLYILKKELQSNLMLTSTSELPTNKKSTLFFFNPGSYLLDMLEHYVLYVDKVKHVWKC